MASRQQPECNLVAPSNAPHELFVARFIHAVPIRSPPPTAGDASTGPMLAHLTRHKDVKLRLWMAISGLRSLNPPAAENLRPAREGHPCLPRRFVATNAHRTCRDEEIFSFYRRNIAI
jgi:hypothetical protein